MSATPNNNEKEGVGDEVWEHDEHETADQWDHCLLLLAIHEEAEADGAEEQPPRDNALKASARVGRGPWAAIAHHPHESPLSPANSRPD